MVGLSLLSSILFCIYTKNMLWKYNPRTIKVCRWCWIQESPKGNVQHLPSALFSVSPSKHQSLLFKPRADTFKTCLWFLLSPKQPWIFGECRAPVQLTAGTCWEIPAFLLWLTLIQLACVQPCNLLDRKALTRLFGEDSSSAVISASSQLHRFSQAVPPALQWVHLVF